MPDTVNWLDIAYLQQGNARQREVHALLQEIRIIELLADYDPLLAGTVPLGIEVEGSDLDLICEVHDSAGFTEEVRHRFGSFDGYSALTRTVKGLTRTKINFNAGGWPIELFGQPVPVLQQNAYLHMEAEWRILNLLGRDFRTQVIALKTEGMKTEPAFARLLNLEGDPYEALLRLGRLLPEELRAVCAGFCLHRTNNRSGGDQGED